MWFRSMNWFFFEDSYLVEYTIKKTKNYDKSTIKTSKRLLPVSLKTKSMLYLILVLLLLIWWNIT